MSIEENIKILDEAQQAVEARDWDRFDAVHDESVTTYSPLSPEPTKGIAAHREGMQGILKSFPDFVMERDQVFGSGEWICEVSTVKGTHKGPLKGPTGEEIPPTNKPLQFQTCSVMKIVNGKITEEHSYYDLLGMMAQLGLEAQG